MLNPDQTKTPTSHRKSVLVEQERAYGEAIYSQPGDLQPKARTDLRIDQSQPGVRLRMALLDADVSDPNGFERVIGESDFVSVNFLARGIRAADAVCRVRVPGYGGGRHGTAFLVGPGLLMTNNHGLPTPADAAQAEAEFGCEHDPEANRKEPEWFANLRQNSLAQLQSNNIQTPPLPPSPAQLFTRTL